MQYVLRCVWTKADAYKMAVGVLRCLFVGSSSITLIWWINITVYRPVFLSFCVSCRPTSERVSKESCVFSRWDGVLLISLSRVLVKPARNFVDVSYFSKKALCLLSNIYPHSPPPPSSSPLPLLYFAFLSRKKETFFRCVFVYCSEYTLLKPFKTQYNVII